MAKKEQFSMHIQDNQRQIDEKYYAELAQHWDASIGTTLDKLKSFTKYVPFAEFPKLFAKYELFQKIHKIHGEIIECGVHQGGGLMTWALLSSIFEPVNHVRKVVGFDTFEGFADVSSDDTVTGNEQAIKGGLAVDSYSDLIKTVNIYDMFRPLGHISKVHLVKGDAMKTIPQYLEDNPHLVVAMLYLDFDLLKPTKIAIETLRERMPKGAILAFDELYVKQWPGETKALHETLGISSLKIERFSFHPQISYAVLD
jgi:hypothetical protein